MSWRQGVRILLKLGSTVGVPELEWCLVPEIGSFGNQNHAIESNKQRILRELDN